MDIALQIAFDSAAKGLIASGLIYVAYNALGKQKSLGNSLGTGVGIAAGFAIYDTARHFGYFIS